MGPSNCAVIGCFNNSKKLKKWLQEHCEIHGVLHENCSCQKPFTLYMFPSIKRNEEKRDAWIRIMKREKADKSDWKPCGNDRVCSEHFVDGVSTVANPSPTLKLGYNTTAPNPRREIFKHNLKPKKAKLSAPSTLPDVDVLTSPSSSCIAAAPPPASPFVSPPPSPFVMLSSEEPLMSPFSDHSYCPTQSKQPCEDCLYKDSLINAYRTKIKALTQQVRLLKRTLVKKDKSQQSFSVKFMKDDKAMNFYTGITSIKLFNAVFEILEPHIPKLNYWRGTKRNGSRIKNFSSTGSKAGLRKLSAKDEFLLVLMKLRLGLLHQDLATRFGISVGNCSSIFKTWIRFLSVTIGSLVAWLPKEVIQENMPKIFRDTGHNKLRVIIDFSEVFIERPKSLQAQAVTWSDYKSHNTMKFLVGISPAGFTTYLSQCYGGRASDKFICSDSNFYDLLDYYDEVMADRGFQIKEELMVKHCSLSVPPGARLKSQMTQKECKKTKDIANLRIHVERAMKTYRILKSILPITMVHHSDDIVRTCAGLCNLKPLLFKSSIKT